MEFADPRGQAVVRNLIADNHLLARDPSAQSLDLAARSVAVGIGVDQNAHHRDGLRETRLLA